jgi:large subunit ribosomal protein L1
MLVLEEFLSMLIKLYDNAHEIIQTLIKLKPTAAKGTYIKSIHLSCTMSPAIALDPKAV